MQRKPTVQLVVSESINKTRQSRLCLTKFHNLMNSAIIGEWAGLIWKALSEADKLDIKQLKKMTKLKEKEVAYGLGWLAREGKIAFLENGEDNKDMLISLVQ